MKMTLESKLNTMHGDCGRFKTQLATEHMKESLIPAFYLAMLKAMRDAYTLDFYKALNSFAEIDEKDMKDFFERGEGDG